MTKVRTELACLFIGVWMLLLLSGCGTQEHAMVRSGEALTQGEAGVGPEGPASSTGSLARSGRVPTPEGQVIEDMPLAIAGADLRPGLPAQAGALPSDMASPSDMKVAGLLPEDSASELQFFSSGSGGAGGTTGGPGIGPGAPGVTSQIPGMARGSHSDVGVAGMMPENPPRPKSSRAMQSGTKTAGLMSGSTGDLEFFPFGSGGAGGTTGGPGIGPGAPGVTSQIPGMARGSHSELEVIEMMPEGLPQTRGMTTPESRAGAPSSQELAMVSPSEGGGMPRSHMATSRAGLAHVFFDYDQYMIRKQEVPTLEANARLLKTTYQDSTLLVAGHCDERGTVEYNLVLGERRAQAVKDYLVDLGVPASRIEVISYGKEKPFCSEHNVTCWQQNRRGHFVLR